MRTRVAWGMAVVLLLAMGGAMAQEGPDPARRLQDEVREVRDELRRLQNDLRRSEQGVRQVDRRLRDSSGAGGALFLCAVFCALWAQNSGRNPWLWFFLGALFSVITLLVLLSKNAADRRGGRSPAPA